MFLFLWLTLFLFIWQLQLIRKTFILQGCNFIIFCDISWKKHYVI